LLRPHIAGRARCAQLAPLAVGLSFAAGLAVPSVTGAAVTVSPIRSSSVSTRGISANTAIAESADVSTTSSIPVVAGTPAASGISSVQEIAATPGIPAILGKTATHVKLRLRHVDLNVLIGSVATVSGALRPAQAERAVYLQRLGRHGWHGISQTLTGGRGRFVLRYIPRRLLSEPVRIVLAGEVGEPSVRHYLGHLTSYRLTVASWYGGGGALACGGELTSATMGVANKTLPCGTLVTLRYGGHSVRVPVVDRGPYVEGREFDLTEATKRALGFEGVGEVWSNR
jgi:rare lipoprotein A